MRRCSCFSPPRLSGPTPARWLRALPRPQGCRAAPAPARCPRRAGHARAGGRLRRFRQSRVRVHCGFAGAARALRHRPHSRLDGPASCGAGARYRGFESGVGTEPARQRVIPRPGFAVNGGSAAREAAFRIEPRAPARRESGVGGKPARTLNATASGRIHPGPANFGIARENRRQIGSDRGSRRMPVIDCVPKMLPATEVALYVLWMLTGPSLNSSRSAFEAWRFLHWMGASPCRRYYSVIPAYRTSALLRILFD